MNFCKNRSHEFYYIFCVEQRHKLDIPPTCMKDGLACREIPGYCDDIYPKLLL